MLKRIEIDQLRVGMFVESLEGAWVNTKFAGRRFMLASEADAKALKNSNASGVFINTAKGLDAGPAAGTRQAAASAVAARAKRMAQVRARLDEDKAAVAKTVAETTELLKGVFNAVQDGGSITVDIVAPVISQITQAIERNGAIVVSITRLKSKDETTYLHSIAVSALMIRFARYLKMDEETVRILGMSGLLHDIGKLTIPMDILGKEGVLTDSEMDQMRGHPAQGYAMLQRQGDMPEIVLDVCLNHHEHPDGKGYPRGLTGDQISLYARIATICDVYEAITSARPYKRPWSPTEATNWMLERKGFFDRPLLLQFINGVLKS